MVSDIKRIGVGARRAPRTGVAAWAARRRTPLAVAAIAGAAAAVTILYCLRLAGYFVMPDELGYVQQAHFIADHLRPVLPHDAQFGSWSQLQPLLLAGPYAAWSTTTAFDVAHAINAVVMASTAIPAYLLTRRLTAWRGGALLVAGLTVAVPWMTLAGTMLTENVAYPTFVWALLAGHRTITEPRPLNDVLFVVALALAYLARTQLSLLGAAVALAIVVHEVGWRWRGAQETPLRAAGRGLLAAVRGHLVLVGLAVLALIVILSSTSGQLLGGYAAPTEGSLVPPGTLKSAREILAQVVLGIGVAPLALALAFAFGSLWRPRDQATHAFAALTLLTVVLMSIALGSFSVRFTAGVNDRYLFFLAPLFFCGSLVFLLERRRWLVPLALGAAAALWLVASATLAQRGPSLVSPAAAFHDVLADLHIGGVPTTGALLGGAALAAIAIVRVVSPRRRRQATAVCGALLAFSGTETLYTMQKVGDTQKVSGDYLAGRNWVDRALPDGKDAAVLLASFGDRFQSSAVWWDLTFWNLHVDRSVRFASEDDFIQKTSFPLQMDVHSGAVSGIGAPYLIVAQADPRLTIRGARRLATRYGLGILRLPADPHAASAILGSDPFGRVGPGGRASYLLFGPSPRRTVTVVLGNDGPRAYGYRLAGHRGRIAKGQTIKLRVALAAARPGRPAGFRLEVPGKPPQDPATDPGPRIVAVRGPAA